MKRGRSDDNLCDLLVVLGVHRFGTDWPNVATAVRAAIGPLGCEAPAATECEERFRSLVEGVPAELTALAARLQAARIDNLADVRAVTLARLEVLCKLLPPGHPAGSEALAQAGLAASGAAEGAITAQTDGALSGDVDFDEPDGDDDARQGGRTRLAGEFSNPDHELEDSWAVIADEESQNSRRASVSGTLNKMLAAISKHKWAYPFKRPVTDKEAPDYKEIITNPMDFATLKRRVETGQVSDVSTLVNDLNLIFDNAMKYNGEGTDYYKMAMTLKDLVAHQQTLYNVWQAEQQPTETKAAAAVAAEDTGARRRRR